VALGGSAAAGLAAKVRYTIAGGRVVFSYN
jgi:hypothetical protein